MKNHGTNIILQNNYILLFWGFTRKNMKNMKIKNIFTLILFYGIITNAQELVTHYKFDNTLLDETDNDYDLTKSGNFDVIYVTGKDGVGSTAISGFGVSDFLHTTKNLSINGNDSRTFSAWVETAESTWVASKCIMAHGENKMNSKFNLLISGEIKRSDPRPISIIGTSALDEEDDNWIHLVVTYKDNVATLYVNGEVELVSEPGSNNFGPTGIDTTESQLRIGNYFYILEQADQWAIDDVRIYDKGLTAEQVEALYQGDPVSRNVTFTATINNNWANSGNWDSGTEPSPSDNVFIPADKNPKIEASSGFSVKDLTVDSSATLTIVSGSSLIVNGNSSGDIIYNRTIPTTGVSTVNFNLISSPVVGQDIDGFVSNEELETGNGSNVGLGDYNNATPGWSYYQFGSTGSGNFTSGDGRSVALGSLSSDDYISFTGTLNVENNGVDVTLTTGVNNFNLIGNPYPSYIPANLNADKDNNILDINDQNLSEKTLWLWNAANGSYNQINQTSSAMYIAPAQGFFVSASAGNTAFSFEENMQSHQTDTFQKISSSARPELTIEMTNGIDTRDTDIFYIDGTTTGFDNGYDSSIFGGVANNFAIYTHAVANGTGRNLGIQSLPTNNYENMIIPIGVNAVSGTTISIDASTKNFPAAINIYLEDKKDSSFTLLGADSKFSTTLETDFNEIGRFYLHTTSSSLSTGDSLINNNISVYTSSRGNLRIVGIQNGAAKVCLYNLLGKQLLNISFEGNGVNNIALPNFNRGAYLVQLETELGIINKKIILE
jgi:hypothetical protein